MVEAQVAPPSQNSKITFWQQDWSAILDARLRIVLILHLLQRSNQGIQSKQEHSNDAHNGSQERASKASGRNTSLVKLVHSQSLAVGYQSSLTSMAGIPTRHRTKTEARR